jgi:hypothetical protein
MPSERFSDQGWLVKLTRTFRCASVTRKQSSCDGADPTPELSPGGPRAAGCSQSPVCCDGSRRRSRVGEVLLQSGPSPREGTPLYRFLLSIDTCAA